MPLDAVLVLVVEHGQARLVVELLQTLDGETAGVLHLACSRHVTRYSCCRDPPSLPATSPAWLSGCGLPASPVLLQKVRRLGMLVGGIRLLPVDIWCRYV